METKFLDNVGEDLPEAKAKGGFGTSQWNKETIKEVALDCFAKVKASGKSALAFPIYTFWNKVYTGKSMEERQKKAGNWWCAYELMKQIRDIVPNSEPLMKTALNRSKEIGSAEDKCNYIVFSVKK